MARSETGQLLLTGVPGTELDAASAALYREIQPGGFIIFGRNIKTPSQLRKLVDDLRGLSDIEPIITIDQEGGRVSRLRLIGNEPPNAQQLRERDRIELIERHGAITARLLRLFGFNLDLCPVLDISFDDEADNSLRGRCYGRDVAQTIRNAGAFNRTLREGGIASCGKHFPGYSRAPLDAHHELPVIPLTRAGLEEHELAVFRHFIPAGRNPRPEPNLVEGMGAVAVDSMMICHAQYPQLEPDGLPASLSHRIVTGLLREELGFRGLIMTDDLDMGAILNHYSLEETIRLAIGAGNDLAMICHRVESLREARKLIDRLPAAELDRALQSVASFKKHLAPPDPFSEEEFRLRDAEVYQLRLDALGPELAAQRSPEDGKRSPVELY
jgi:beta-N-acetylhexosaminidase